MSSLYVLASGAATAASAVSTMTAVGASAASDTVATGTIQSLVTSIVPSIVASALPSTVTTTAPVTSQALFLPVWFEIAAIFAGALSGGVTAVKLRFDVTGVLVLALVNGLGGGILRDVLLQDYGIFALDTPRALFAVLAAAGIAMFFLAVATRIAKLLIGIDAFSLGLFCIVGADKALVAGLMVVPAIMLGTATAVGGGMIRDVLCDKEPEILRRGSLSATAAFVGSAVYVLLVTWLNVTKPAAMIAAAAVAVVLRVGSLWLGWESPEPVDLTPAVTAVPRRVVRGASMLRRTTRGSVKASRPSEPTGEAETCIPQETQPADDAAKRPTDAGE